MPAFLRSVFISVAMVIFVTLAVNAGMALVRGATPWPSWLGLLMAAGAPAAFFTWVFVRKPPRTAPHPVGISVVSGLGLAIALAMSWRYGETAGPVHILAGIAVVTWFVYLRWYSRFPNRRSPQLTIGQPLPEFSLRTIEGEEVTSGSFSGQPHVLLFYRGNWCPFCTAQVQELAAAYRDIDAQGARVVLISPQSAGKTAALAKRFEAPMTFLTDPHGGAASALGITAKWGTPMGMQALGYASDTVLPTVIVTDSDGRIAWVSETDNYRVRPEPETFLEVLRGLPSRTPAGA